MSYKRSKRYLQLLGLLLLSSKITYAGRIPFAGLELPYETQIQVLVDSVNIDSVMGCIREQGKFYTRFFLTDSSYAAADWLQQKLTSWGYAAIKDSFWLVPPSWISSDSGYEYNIIGRKTGLFLPDNIIILSGHRDAISAESYTMDPYSAAPGADDDASGVAAAMEAARIFKDITWDKTFEFIGFGAEESGTGDGALKHARQADSLDWKIDAMIDCDMIGYEILGGVMFGYFSEDTLGGYALSKTFIKLGSLYVSDLSVLSGGEWFLGILGAPNAYAFMSYRFPAVQVTECGCTMNPYYHTANDTAGVLNPAFLLKTVRLMVAGMAVLNLYPSPVESLSITNPGDGEHLIVSWEALPEPDVNFYRIYYGTASGVFDSLTVNGLCDTLEGLQAESSYHLTVRGFDADGHPGWFAWDFTGTTALSAASADDPKSCGADRFFLESAYPNPVHDNARIIYRMPEERHLSMSIYDIQGRVVKHLFAGVVLPGRREIIWHGNNDKAQPVGNGVYFLRAESQGEIYTRKILILK